jgi:Flp pilus assembly protein TadB
MNAGKEETTGSGRDDKVSARLDQIWLRDDGIVQAVQLPGTEQTRADAERNIAAIWEVAGRTRRPLLVDLRRTKGMDRDARTYYASPAPARVVFAVALLVGSPLTRAIATFLLALQQKPLVPIRMFTSEPEAIGWLLGLVR